jgi:CBS domain-containing protein
MAYRLPGRTVMKSVAQLLKFKNGQLYSISPNSSVYDCVQMLADKGVGALLVMEGPKLVGIVSERDYARKVILVGKSSKTTRVSEIMTEDVLCVNPRMTNEECMALMTAKRIRHLPVVDADTVVGVISIGDLVRDIINEQQFAIKELERYIHG